MDLVQYAAQIEADVATLHADDKCQTAKVMFRDQFGLYQIISRLVLVLVAATVIALVVAIGMALASRPAGAISGAIGTVVTGAAAGFVLKERSDARSRVDKLRALRERLCP